MSSVFRQSRPLLLGALILAVASTSGCSWFKKKNADYSSSPENRPLEVPPDLDLPDTSAATVVPSSANLGAGVRTSNAGVLVPGSATDVWAKVGQVLGGVSGVEVTGRAEALRTYDVSYQGQSFLIRVEDAGGQSRVAAISPDGQIMSGGAAGQLLRAIKGAF